MSEPRVGFLTMGTAPLARDLPHIGIGMLGYAFMGKAHSNAYKKMPYMMYPPPAIPRLVAICGRNAEAVRAAAQRYGYETAYTDWREMLADRRVQVFDNGAPNDVHADPCIAAARVGMHIFCEKPLARSAEEARPMVEAVTAAGVKHMVAFNYRFVPALRQARELIHAGDLGEIYHFRAAFLQEWIADPAFPRVWRLDQKVAGSGVLGDLGTHIIDLARFFIGEVRTVSGVTKTFVPNRPLPDGQGRGRGPVEVEDAFAAAVEFANGAIGTLEATRFAPGRKNHQVIEVNGSKGSLRFDLERMNELEVFWTSDAPRETRGFHRVLVTESYHPFFEHWWPHGSIIGWEHTFVHEVYHMLDAIVNNKPIAPHGATFEDGYRASLVADAIAESARTGRRVTVPA